jgi:hypothetical protein
MATRHVSRSCTPWLRESRSLLISKIYQKHSQALNLIVSAPKGRLKYSGLRTKFASTSLFEPTSESNPTTRTHKTYKKMN